METISDKMDASLQLALQLPMEEREKSPILSSGYEEEQKTWEVILRIAGQIETLQQQFPQAAFTPLSGGYVIARVLADELEDLASQDQVIYIEQPKRMVTGVAQGVRASCIWPLQQEITPVGHLSGRGVFVAVIDSGIDYFHPDFRNEDGTTRIAWLWADGKEYSETQINAALEQKDMKKALEIVPVTDISGHGTHVAGIAAGNGRASGGRNRGVAYESRLLVVQIKNRGRDAAPLTTQLMEAVEYVARKAIEEKTPVAINISYGNNYGSHTGSSLLETYLTQMAKRWKMSIVIGTGNEGQEPLHFQGRFAAQERQKEQEVEWVIDTYETSMNLQLWKNYQDKMTIFLIAPDGTEMMVLREEQQEKREGTIVSAQWRDTVIHVFYDVPSPYHIQQEIYLTFLPREAYIDAGVWKLRLQPQHIKDGRYALWLPVSGALNENSGFLYPSEESTITVPATAEGVISVGAYDSRRNEYASFSGRGFVWQTEAIKPDLVAPGVNITSCAPAGGYAVRSGTSMATPFVTGAAALIMQWGIVENKDPYAYGEKLKAYLLRGAQEMPIEPMPSKRIGWGKLCLRESLR